MDQCKTQRQSPIQIITANAATSVDLRPLDLVKGWTKPVSGTYVNSGHTVTFRPNASSVTTLQTHTGEYVLDNFHYHWGGGEGLAADRRTGWTESNTTWRYNIHLIFKKLRKGEHYRPQCRKCCFSPLGILVKSVLTVQKLV